MQDTILIVGQMHDPLLSHWIAWKDDQVRYAFLDVAMLNKQIHIHDQGICWGDQYVDHKSILGVFNRLISIEQDMDYILLHFMQCIWPKVVNRPLEATHNYSKLYQLRDLEKWGVSVPETWVCTQSLPLAVDGRWIFKSVCALRSSVYTLAQKPRRGFPKDPVMLQPDMGRDHVRVHVLNGQCWMTKLISDCTDYRLDPKVSMTSCFIDEIAEMSLKISVHLDVCLCGIDWVYDQDHWVCLEVNTAPGFSYFEQHQGSACLSKALHRYFIEDAQCV